MHWMKHNKIYFTLSGFLIIVSITSLIFWKLKLGIDFTGGSIIDYRFSKEIETSQIDEVFKKSQVENVTIESTDKKNFNLKTSAISSQTKSTIDEDLKKIDENFQELRYEVVGPAIGPELIEKTVYALLFSAGVILLWVAYQFKNIKFGLAAVLAMLHDSIVLLGSFSLMGHFWGVEIDFLFVTAMLTILSFSVHDTIVVFDRIREDTKKMHSELISVSDRAITETMSRSLNNSFTIIFMLVALVLLGGESIRWFAVALLIGTISGTYSSPFVAIPLLVTFDKVKNFKPKLKLRK